MFEFIATAAVRADDAPTEVEENEKLDDKTNLVVLKGSFSSGGEEFQTTRGSTGEFIEFLQLCVLTEREVVAGNEDYLVVEAESETDAAGISDCSYYSDRLEELVGIACAHFRPSGFHYDYNDGCYDRYSGYSMSSESVGISLRESANAPAREKMLGMVRLKEKLFAMEVEEEEIKRLTAF